uniref:Dbuz\CG14609c-PA n=1 Tax=Drosophila buzzatii TaxID=7264 RepID=Q4VIV4_DROBU|nr:Dbuz\CG14609c-PA [Drosophila buzzatii]
MPCFQQEKSLEFCLKKKNSGRDALVPKALRARPIRFHGLFGMSFASQHLMVDQKWTPQSLTDQFAGMSNLLTRRIIYKRHETKANRLRLIKQSKHLKTECFDGRIKLKNVSSADNLHKIRNYLNDHIDMQRLYRQMPVHLIVDNINQRSFVLRKERDRLEFRLGQVKHKYKTLLRERCKLENLMRYEHYFVLEEEKASRILMKKIDNSNVRLKAIRNINTTYKKMIQVLLQDEIFYEPILRSLDDDMVDQALLIKHILYLGMPAIAKYKELNRDFQALEEKARKNFQGKIQIIASLQQQQPRAVNQRNVVEAKEIPSADPKRYVRETRNMAWLKLQLQSIEKTIKELKLVTLCSQAKEIYSQFKGQVESNVLLDRKIEHDMQTHNALMSKMNRANVLQDVLINNLTEEEINRLDYIKVLKATLKNDEEFEKSNLEYITDRSHVYTMFRFSVWNLFEIVRHVDRNPKTFRTVYPNSYLKLPLLKFEMLEMFSVPPEAFEIDVEVLMNTIKRKVYKLMKAYSGKMLPALKKSKEQYHQDFLNTFQQRELFNDSDRKTCTMSVDLMEETKVNINVPSRKQIKAQSARLVEDAVKREEN